MSLFSSVNESIQRTKLKLNFLTNSTLAYFIVKFCKLVGIPLILGLLTFLAPIHSNNSPFHFATAPNKKLFPAVVIYSIYFFISCVPYVSTLCKTVFPSSKLKFSSVIIQGSLTLLCF